MSTKMNLPSPPGLMELDNVILLLHVGSGTLETRLRMASMAVENLITGLRGKVPPNLVNQDVLSHRRL
jgi:lactate dehydrogenase-like 2-hydroxyacid dehydrogenase